MFTRSTSIVFALLIVCLNTVLAQSSPPVSFLAARIYGTGGGPNSVAVGDFNGDGKPDLAVANGGDNTVSVLLGNGDGTFQAAVNYDGWFGTRLGGGGGLQRRRQTRPGGGELCGNDPTCHSSGTVSVLLGNGDGTFQAAVNYGAGTNPNSVAVGDFNGDGKPDLAVANGGSNTVSVLLGNGDGTFQAAVTYGAGSEPVLGGGG